MRSTLSLVLLGALCVSCAGTSFRYRQKVDWFRSGNYGGVMVGTSRLDVTSSDLDRALLDRGYTSSSDLERDDLALNVYVGHRFELPFAVELGYVNLGQVESQISAMPPDVNAFVGDIADVHPLLGRGIQLQGRWFAYTTQRSELSVSAGFWVWEGEVDAAAGSGETAEVDRDGVDPTVGIAATIGLTDRWDLRAGWDRYWLDDDAADAFWLGVQVGLL